MLDNFFALQRDLSHSEIRNLFQRWIRDWFTVENENILFESYHTVASRDSISRPAPVTLVAGGDDTTRLPMPLG
jgi:hypothetical protein